MQTDWQRGERVLSERRKWDNRWAGNLVRGLLVREASGLAGGQVDE